MLRVTRMLCAHQEHDAEEHDAEEVARPCASARLAALSWGVVDKARHSAVRHGLRPAKASRLCTKIVKH